MSQTTIENATDATLYLRERQFPAMDGHYGRTITVDPRCVRDDVSSTVISDRNRNSLRASVIVIFLDGNEFETALTPEDLIHFVKLIFELDPLNGDLLVTGIRAKLTDISRIWGFGFLGRSYARREREYVLTSRLLNRAPEA